jgi:hypothetical protein
MCLVFPESLQNLLFTCLKENIDLNFIFSHKLPKLQSTSFWSQGLNIHLDQSIGIHILELQMDQLEVSKREHIAY